MKAEDKLFYLKKHLETVINELEENQKEFKDYYTAGKLRAYKNVLIELED